MPEDPDYWETIVDSPFWPVFTGMIAWFKEGAARDVMTADTTDKLRTAQGELRAYHALLTLPEKRALMVKQAKERALEAHLQESSANAERRGSSGTAGIRRGGTNVR